MKLYERDLMECVLLRRIYSDDGEGGRRIDYIAAKRFSAAIIPERTHEQEVAGKDYRMGRYSVYIPNEYDVSFYHGDRFRSNEGRMFHVIGKAQAPPEVSVIKFRKITAEAVMGEDGV